MKLAVPTGGAASARGAPSHRGAASSGRGSVAARPGSAPTGAASARKGGPASSGRPNSPRGARPGSRRPSIDCGGAGATAASAPATAAAAGSKPPSSESGGGKQAASPLRAWLEDLAVRPGGFLDALAEAVSPLCGLDPEKQPGRLKTLEDVRKALEGADSLGRLAGQISHAASLSAARVAFEAPLDITLVPEGPAKKLILEAIQKEKEASGPVGKAIPPMVKAAFDTAQELRQLKLRARPKEICDQLAKYLPHMEMIYRAADVKDVNAMLEETRARTAGKCADCPAEESARSEAEVATDWLSGLGLTTESAVATPRSRTSGGGKKKGKGKR